MKSIAKTSFFSFLFLCGITLLCALGFWQLNRSTEKQHLQDLLQQAASNKPFTNTALLASAPNSPLRFMPVTLQGTFENEHTILLDNQIHQGQAGYHVIVPFRLDDKTLILVNRGWIPLGRTRQKLPSLPPIMGEATIEGFLEFAYRNPLISRVLESPTIKWPLRMQQLDLELISRLVGKNIYPMLVKTNRDFIQSNGLSPQRHQGYAVQWFGLAATLFIFYLIYLKKRSRS